MSSELTGLSALRVLLSAGGGNEQTEPWQRPSWCASLVGVVICFGVRVGSAKVKR